MAGREHKIDYRRLVWDRLEGVPYPGEHQNLFGHDEALDMLIASFNSAQMHHAWLISGPRGIGKATLAYLIAGHMLRNPQAILVPVSNTNPGTEDAVSSIIARGGHPNILHLARPFDAKTKKFRTVITVDEIRRTIAFFGTTRAQDNWRICIVDTADDMNENAANALLKILEEPPRRTVFFVIANSPGALLPTIRSRCRHLPLRPLSHENLELALGALGALGAVPAGEGEEPELLARLSAGSVRRALLLMKQDGLQLYRRFLAILGEPGLHQPDWSKVHVLADELSRKNKDEHYRLLLDITRGYIADVLHKNASKASVGPGYSPMQIREAQTTLSNLARMCEVWEKTAKSSSLAERYNLDKKQVILNLFGSLAQVGV